MYELFEHTADLGLRVRAPDLDALFREAAQGLFAMIVEPLPHGPCVKRMPFAIAGERYDFLLFDWLNELLYFFDTERMMMGEFEVAIEDHTLRATASGFELDTKKYCLLREVKAITYHGLRVESTDDGWLAEVIVDI